MNKRLLLLLMLIQLQGWAQEDMNAYLQKTKELIHEKEYKEALKRSIWFHNNALNHDASMFSVRLSFALADWKQLADKYPPAHKALLKTRDKKIKQLLDDKTNPVLFLDVLSINRALHLEKENVILFEKLALEKPSFIKKHWKLAKKDLFENNRFDILKKYIGNPLKEFQSNFKVHLKNSDICDPNSEYEQRRRSYSEERFIYKTLQLIEMALVLGDKNMAQEIQQKALELVDDYRIENALSKN